MQYQQNHQPVLPGSGQAPQAAYPPSGQQPPVHQPQHKRRHGRLARFMRGYLMLVGALTTLYALVMLLVSLFVEIGKWSPTIPIG